MSLTVPLAHHQTPYSWFQHFSSISLLPWNDHHWSYGHSKFFYIWPFTFYDRLVDGQIIDLWILKNGCLHQTIIERCSKKCQVVLKFDKYRSLFAAPPPFLLSACIDPAKSHRKFPRNKIFFSSLNWDEKDHSHKCTRIDDSFIGDYESVLRTKVLHIIAHFRCHSTTESQRWTDHLECIISSTLKNCPEELFISFPHRQTFITYNAKMAQLQCLWGDNWSLLMSHLCCDRFIEWYRTVHQY